MIPSYSLRLQAFTLAALQIILYCCFAYFVGVVCRFFLSAPMGPSDTVVFPGATINGISDSNLAMRMANLESGMQQARAAVDRFQGKDLLLAKALEARAFALITALQMP